MILCPFRGDGQSIGDKDMRFFWIAAVAIPLSGCALPPVVSVASMAFDFASYGETGKTIKDHAISIVLQRDCALLRVFEGPICEEEDETPIALASLYEMTDPVVAIGQRDPIIVPTDLAYLEGAAAGAVARSPEAGPDDGFWRQGFAADRDTSDRGAADEGNAAADPLGFGDYLGAGVTIAVPAGPDRQVSAAGYLTDGVAPSSGAASATHG